jgi:hypothetical protein
MFVLPQEVIMANKKFLEAVLRTASMLGIVLAFGMVVIGCDPDGDDAGDPLDGTTWDQTSGDSPDGSGGLRLTINSPNFTCTGIDNGTVYMSGTYGGSGNSFTGTITYGDVEGGTISGTISGNTMAYTITVNNEIYASGTMDKKNDPFDGTTWEQITGKGVPDGGLRVTIDSHTYECKGITNNIEYASGTYVVSGNTFTGTITGGRAKDCTLIGTIIDGNTMKYEIIGYGVSGIMHRKYE